VKRILREFPQECALLALYFEETAKYRQEEDARMRRESRNRGDMRVDSTIGDDDERDWSVADGLD
jgi:hypothetical protein